MTSQLTLKRTQYKNFALAKLLADDGLGWEDIKVACNISEREAKIIVFGKWKRS